MHTSVPIALQDTRKAPACGVHAKHSQTDSAPPDLGDLVREFGPVFTAELVAACGAGLTATLVRHFGNELTGAHAALWPGDFVIISTEGDSWICQVTPSSWPDILLATGRKRTDAAERACKHAPSAAALVAEFGPHLTADIVKAMGPSLTGELRLSMRG